MGVLLTFSKPQLMFLLSLLSFAFFLCALCLPWWWTTVEYDDSEVSWDFYFNKITRTAEDDDYIRIETVDWGDSTGGQYTNYGKFQNKFINSWWLSLAGTLCSLCLLAFTFMTICTPCICRCVENWINLFKIICTFFANFFLWMAVLLFSLELPGAIKHEEGDNCTGPCESLSGSDEVAGNDRTWGVHSAFYCSVLNMIPMLVLLGMTIIYRSETPKPGQTVIQAKTITVYMSCKCGWSWKTWLFWLGVLLNIFFITSLASSWWWFRMEQDGVKTTMKLSIQEVRTYQYEGDVIGISKRSWDEASGNFGIVNSDTKGIFILTFSLTLVGYIFYFASWIMSVVLRFTWLRCRCIGEWAWMVQLVGASVGWLFATLGWILFVAKFSDYVADGVSSCPDDIDSPCNCVVGSQDINGAEFDWGLEFGWVFCLFSSLTLVAVVVIIFLSRREEKSASKAADAGATAPTATATAVKGSTELTDPTAAPAEGCDHSDSAPPSYNTDPDANPFENDHTADTEGNPFEQQI